jgi:NAD-dependent deacetylase
MKQKYPHLVEVITQNVDDLLERAQCNEVLHLHGFLPQLRCMTCKKIVNIEYAKQDTHNSTCACAGKMRPNIVFFGEPAPQYETLHKLLDEDCGLLVIIGTSGYVIDVSLLSQYADKSILNNLEPSPAIEEECFDKIYYEDANTAYEKIEQDIEHFIGNKPF